MVSRWAFEGWVSLGFEVPVLSSLPFQPTETAGQWLRASSANTFAPIADLAF